MVSRITMTTIETRTRMPTKIATVIPIAAPTPAPDDGVVEAGRAGSHAWPFQCHNRSWENAGLHWAPSHHQKPSAENRVWAAAGGGAPGSPMTEAYPRGPVSFSSGPQVESGIDEGGHPGKGNGQSPSPSDAN